MKSKFARCAAARSISFTLVLWPNRITLLSQREHAQGGQQTNDQGVHTREQRYLEPVLHCTPEQRQRNHDERDRRGKYRDRGRWLSTGAAAQDKRAEHNFHQDHVHHSDAIFYGESDAVAEDSFQSDDDYYQRVSSEDTRVLSPGPGNGLRD